MTPAQRDDTRWFRQHPDRTYRMRFAIGDEATEAPSRVVQSMGNKITTKPFKGTALFNSELTSELAFNEGGDKWP